MVSGALFLGSDIYRTSSYGRQHPLAIPRVSTVIDLARALGWLAPASYIETRPAAPEALARFHAPDYIAALRRAEAGERLDGETLRRYNIGCNGNPIFREIFSRPATACGASLLAAELLLEGRARLIYSPAGGTHHGRSDRASGFCYLNDPVLALLRLLDGGARRILYLDIDAHHCDGVADAFAAEPRVTICSVHEQGRWPNTGAATELGCDNLFNLPVPPGFNDSEMELLVEQVMRPLAERLDPDFVILQGGADALDEDPLSKLALSNQALWRTVAFAESLGKPLLLLGGGGYNPWSVGRCWTGHWALLAGHEIPERMPPAGEAVMRLLHWSRSAGRNPPEHWFTTLADAPRRGPVRRAVQELAQFHRARLTRPAPCLEEVL
jgi:acetoin utilization protein AcuC